MLPVIYGDIRHYTSYRFECALRSSAILGFIGLPTLGYHLESFFQEGRYSESAALLFAFYAIIASLSYWVRPRLALVYVALSILWVPKELHLAWENVVRFFTRDIVPWPLRDRLVASEPFPWRPLGDWLWEILRDRGWEGVQNTLVLTQLALVATGVLTLIFFPLVCRHFVRPWAQRGNRLLLIVLRTTPEYILAYIMVQLWGPSMLPGLVALALHNGAILGHLTGKNADLLPLQADLSSGRLNRFSFEVLPQIYGQFLAFLFYRWEVIMRESAILGILGIYTLGFYIDSAIAEEKLDEALILILLTSLLNILIDTFSQYFRRNLPNKH